MKGRKDALFFKLELTHGESYLEGIASTTGREYRINIQGGRTEIVLPDGIEALKRVDIIFETKEGEIISFRTFISAVVFARRLESVPLGRAANAAFVGAKTVRGDVLVERAPTRLAAFTAVTSVVKL